MSSASDWYARKLGGPLKPGIVVRPPAAPPQPPATPYGPQPPPGYGQPQQPPPGPQQGAGGITEALQQGHTQGGEAVRKGEVHSCPSCGSKDYFSAKGSGVVNVTTGMIAHAKGECFNCGYPTVQFGSESGGGSAAAVKGTGRARQASGGYTPADFGVAQGIGDFGGGA